MSVIKLLTVGEIARRLGCPIHKILYLIQSRQIVPIQRAGALRVFDDSVLDLIRSEMAIDRRHHPIRQAETNQVAAGAI